MPNQLPLALDTILLVLVLQNYPFPLALDKPTLFLIWSCGWGGERQPDTGRTNLSKYLPFCIFGILYLPFAYFVFCICLCIFCIFLSHQSNIVMWSKFCPSAFKCLLCSIILSPIFNVVAISIVRV